MVLVERWLGTERGEKAMREGKEGRKGERKGRLGEMEVVCGQTQRNAEQDAGSEKVSERADSTLHAAEAVGGRRSKESAKAMLRCKGQLMGTSSFGCGCG